MNKCANCQFFVPEVHHCIVHDEQTSPESSCDRFQPLEIEDK